jgi:hypothetical protein
MLYTQKRTEHRSYAFGHIARQLKLIALVVQSVSAGFIDMDTPLDKRTTTSMVDGTVYHLVSSRKTNDIPLQRCVLSSA